MLLVGRSCVIVQAPCQRGCQTASLWLYTILSMLRWQLHHLHCSSGLHCWAGKGGPLGLARTSKDLWTLLAAWCFYFTKYPLKLLSDGPSAILRPLWYIILSKVTIGLRIWFSLPKMSFLVYPKLWKMHIKQDLPKKLGNGTSAD